MPKKKNGYVYFMQHMTTFIGNWITLHDQPNYVNSINNDMLRQIVMKK